MTNTSLENVAITLAKNDTVCVLLCMPTRSSKAPIDLNKLASFILDQATDEEKKNPEEEFGGKNPAAVMLGRLGGLKGGVARAKKLSKKRRKEIAQKAAKARWGKNN